MKKIYDHGDENHTNKQALPQAKDTSNNIQSLKRQGHAVNVNNDTMKSAMKDLQQKISDAKNSENKGEVIQNAVFEMMQNMGLKIPTDVINKIKNKRGGK